MPTGRNAARRSRHKYGYVNQKTGCNKGKAVNEFVRTRPAGDWDWEWVLQVIVRPGECLGASPSECIAVKVRPIGVGQRAIAHDLNNTQGREASWQEEKIQIAMIMSCTRKTLQTSPASPARIGARSTAAAFQGSAQGMPAAPPAAPRLRRRQCFPRELSLGPLARAPPPRQRKAAA